MNESIVRMSEICYFSICKNYMVFYLDYSIPNKLTSKPGGLESWEQSRLALISLNMSRPFFWNCWLFLNSQDQDLGLNFSLIVTMSRQIETLVGVGGGGYCYLSLGGSTVESNLDQDWLVSTCWDQLFETVDYFSTFKTKI